MCSLYDFFQNTIPFKHGIKYKCKNRHKALTLYHDHDLYPIVAVPCAFALDSCAIISILVMSLINGLIVLPVSALPPLV